MNEVDQNIEEYMRKEHYPVQTEAQLGKEILSIDEDYRVFEYYVPVWEKGTLAVAMTDSNGKVYRTKHGFPIYELKEIDYIKEMEPKYGKLPLKFITGDFPKSNLDIGDVRLLFYIGMLEEVLTKAQFIEPGRDYTYSLLALGQLKNSLIQLKRSYEGFAVHASKAAVRINRNFDFVQDMPESYYPKETKEKKKNEKKIQEEQVAQSPPPSQRRGGGLFDAYFGRP